MKPYNKKVIPFARVLRGHMTPWERKLWFTYLKPHSFKFVRQKILGGYIADFYCAKARLVIELDGSGHYTDAGEFKDRIRTQNLENTNLKVVRFSNLDVDKNFSDVCEYIDYLVRNLSQEDF